MAKKNDTTFFENKLLDFVTAKDPLLEMLQWVMDKFMEIEVARKTGAQKGIHCQRTGNLKPRGQEVSMIFQKSPDNYIDTEGSAPNVKLSVSAPICFRNCNISVASLCDAFSMVIFKLESPIFVFQLLFPHRSNSKTDQKEYSVYQHNGGPGGGSNVVGEG
jgi:hypothetical protein